MAVGERLLVGGFERIGGVGEVVLDPARDVDAQPAQELQGLHRPADREREDERHGRHAARLALVVVVGDEVLRGVDVVDDLRHEESAARLLFGEQPQVLVLAPGVALGDRDSAERQGRVGAATQSLGVGE